mmetsp:Transcript_30346/g.40336  ORF Transcript_30346/g.40336 Transcript_30346/m.40336 type:complete len:85 (-) Transcript_30346:546-800(-)
MYEVNSVIILEFFDAAVCNSLIDITTPENHVSLSGLDIEDAVGWSHDSHVKSSSPKIEDQHVIIFIIAALIELNCHTGRRRLSQ